MADRTLNHFASFAFSEAFWRLAPEERAALPGSLLQRLAPAVARVRLYQVYPARADADFLLWSTVDASDPASAAAFFRCFAHAVNPYRECLRPVGQPAGALWGFTKPSQYARGQSSQEIDPLADDPAPYLIVYPFVKTKDWYLMSKDARQGMMNEHIRTGHQYPSIKQLLLYSFGLQDQEFVVVYTAPDLAQFSDLVNDLRGVEGRRYTERDTPTTTAVYCAPTEGAALWGAAR